MVGGSDPNEVAARTGLPLDLLSESETFAQADGIYPDNLDAVAVFADLLTQWRWGPAGPTGLDYTALSVVLDLRDIASSDRASIFDGVKVMEREALATIREQRG